MLKIELFALADGRVWRWCLMRDDLLLAYGDEFTARAAIGKAMAAHDNELTATIKKPG
jgi:hypothetical protein